MWPGGWRGPAATAERKPGADNAKLLHRLAEMPGLPNRKPADVFGYLYNGAFALESVPAAFYCFLSSFQDPEAMP
jgi:hypothetical protein